MKKKNQIFKKITLTLTLTLLNRTVRSTGPALKLDKYAEAHKDSGLSLGTRGKILFLDQSAKLHRMPYFSLQQTTDFELLFAHIFAQEIGNLGNSE